MGTLCRQGRPIPLGSRFAAMKGNMSLQNDVADVLSCNYLQAYSSIKRLIRYNRKDPLVTQGIAIVDKESYKQCLVA